MIKFAVQDLIPRTGTGGNMAILNAQKEKVLLIGSGRLCFHMQFYFKSLGISVLTWDRSQDPHLLNSKIQEATHVLLGISDGAIEAFYNQHLAGLDKIVVHFSGALNINDVISAHPLMTFTNELYAESFYPKIHFVLTGCNSLPQAIPGIPNSFSILDADKKALYHAHCVAGGNFISILAAEFMDAIKELNIPEQAGRTFLEASLKNALNQHWDAITGPLVRNDINTISKNIAALKNHRLQNIYQAFSKAWGEK